MSDLRTFWAKEGKAAWPDAEIFLLRNLTRGAGIGFFAGRGFYPDFILWIMTPRRQHIVFVEPHGMIHARSYEYDEKARLHERLPELARLASRRSGKPDVKLDSYIVSATPFETLKSRYGNEEWERDRFAEKHICSFRNRNNRATGPTSAESSKISSAAPHGQAGSVMPVADTACATRSLSSGAPTQSR